MQQNPTRPNLKFNLAWVLKYWWLECMFEEEECVLKYCLWWYLVEE